MRPLDTTVPISDIAIWYRHVQSADLRSHLEALAPEEEITLLADDVVGRWRRMRTGKDGRPVQAIVPVGRMKDVWSAWYRERRGAHVTLRPVRIADDYLAAAAATMSEWSSPEDDEAFGDL